MSVLEALIKRRVLTTVLVLIAIIMGALSYLAMGVRRFPDIDFPMAMILTSYPGSTPEEVEAEISITIEDAISTVSGVEEIQSYSQHGMSLIMVEFGLDEDIDIKAMDLRDEIDMIREMLPDDAEDPVVRKFDFEQFPVLTLALSGPQDVNELYRIAEDYLEDPLARVSGVAEVDITGGQRREIHVLLNPFILRSYGISPAQVGAALRAANVEIPAGETREPMLEYSIRTVGKFRDLEDIARVPVVSGDDSTVYVDHLGEVVDTFEDETERSRADGRASVVLNIQKQADANDVEISEGVHEQLPGLRDIIPDDVELFVTEDTSDFISGALANVRTNILIGMLLTALAIYLFFSSWRGTIIAGVVMPSALVIAFTFMMFFGLSINILTLTALALSVGIVVNNSILILENTNRLIEEGMAPSDAAVAGTKDIGLAIISSTATNLVVFLPIAFMGEIIGRFFTEFGFTIVFATTVSLLISFTLTPMMCGALLKRNNAGNGNWFISIMHIPPKLWQSGVEWLKENYLGVLQWCLRWRKTTLILTLFLVIGSFAALFAVVGAEFFPRSDEGAFRITVETGLGSSLEWTAERVLEIEQIVEEQLPEGYLEHYYSRVGTVSGFVGGVSSGAHLGEVSVTIIDAMDRPESVEYLVNNLRPHLADVHSAQLTVTTETMGGPGGDPIEIDIYGADIGELQDIAGRVMEITAATSGTTDVDQSYRTGRPDLTFTPDHAMLSRHELDASEMGGALRAYIEGQTPTQFLDDDEEYDIRLRLQERYRQWSEDVRSMFVRSPVTGKMVPLTELGELQYVASPVSILRKDGRRLITVSAQLTGERTLGEVRDDIQGALDTELDLPGDVSIEFAGEVEVMRDNFAELFRAMGTAGVLTFLCTAGIIESFFLAIVIILTIPVSFVGVVLALILGGVALNVFSIMAMIMLVGMVVNNAIIVLDYATRKELQHLPPRQRVYDACKLRFRVLLMANLTTIAAMVPLSLGLGFGGEIFRPLALVQMGGVAAAGTLALLVIPVIYTSWYNLVERAKK